MEHQNLGERIATLEIQMQAALDGVSNFKKFQNESAQKLGFVYGATWIAGIVGAIVLALAGFAAPRIFDYMQNMEQLREEFHEVHKSQLPNKKSLYTSPEQVYSVRNQSQTAGGFYQ